MAPNPIEPAAAEAIWNIVVLVYWIVLVVAVVLVANWLLNRILGKPVRWTRRWAGGTASTP